MNTIYRDYKLSVVLYLVNRFCIAVSVLVSMGFMSFSKFLYYVTIWAGIHDDSEWYAAISQVGYWRQDTPFFPLYPFMAHIVELFRFSAPVSLLVVSNVAFIVCDVLLLQLVGKHFPRRIAVLSAVLFSVWPVAFYLSSGYTETIYLACMLASVLSLENKRYILAGSFAGLTAAARNTGIFLLVPLAWAAFLVWRESGFKIRDLLKSTPFLGGVIGALIAGVYPIFLWVRFGSPLLFTTYEKLWAREFMFPVLTLINGFWRLPGEVFDYHSWYLESYYLLQAGSVLLSLAALPTIWRTMPRLWFWLTVAFIAVPLSDPAIGAATITPTVRHITDYFFSFDRFILPMFPLFVAIAQRLRGVAWRPLAGIALSGGGLIFLSVPIDYHVFLG